jgi:hypothetical protein
MADKTVRDFQVSLDIGPVADAWASGNHFGLREVQPDGTRLYQRGNGILTGSMHTSVRQQGKEVHLEAWIHANLLARACALFLIPTNKSIESGGLVGAIPRNMARDAVNKLLAQVGQPAIP